MKLKTAADVLAVVKDRGLKVRIDVGPPKMPILIRPHSVNSGMVTYALMNALRAWRLEIIAELESKP